MNKVIKLIILLFFITLFSALFTHFMGISKLKSFLVFLREVDRVYIYLFGIISMAILPALGFPISALYISSGIALNWQRAMEVAIIGVSINLFLSYYIPKLKIGKPIAKFVNPWGIDFTRRYNASEILRTAIVCRIFPGIPFCVQNYFLAFFKTPFGPYYVSGLALQLGWAMLFILSGDSLLNSNYYLFILLACVILSLVLILSLFKNTLFRLITETRDKK